MVKHHYPNFEILRLLLALEVVLAHIFFVGKIESVLDKIIPAVPAFLAISGFLVLQSYEGSKGWIHFMWKRVLRIIPALAVSLLLALFVWGWRETLNSILNWLTGGLYQLEGVNANGPLWSLMWEEAAYATLALLWIFGAYQKKWPIWGLLGLSMLSMWRFGPYLSGHYQIILALPITFFIGNLCYLYRARLVAVPPLVPLLMLVAVLGYDGKLLGWPGVQVSFALQAFAVVWFGMCGPTLWPHFRSFKLPDVSYGIYVYHYIFLSGVYARFATTKFELVFLTLVFTFGFGVLSWYLVERPALRYKHWIVRSHAHPADH